MLLPHVCSSSKADTQCCVRASGQIVSILAEGRKSKVRFPSASPVTAVGFRGRHWSCTTFGVKAPGIPAYVLCFSVLLNLLLLNILETAEKSSVLYTFRDNFLRARNCLIPMRGVNNRGLFLPNKSSPNVSFIWALAPLMNQLSLLKASYSSRPWLLLL